MPELSHENILTLHPKIKNMTSITLEQRFTALYSVTNFQRIVHQSIIIYYDTSAVTNVSIFIKDRMNDDEKLSSVICIHDQQQ